MAHSRIGSASRHASASLLPPIRRTRTHEIDIEGRLVGSAQLALPCWPNAPHRSEVQKVLVAPGKRGQGVGRSLMAALHGVAWQQGRSLLILNARQGGPAVGFYKGLGYQEVGVVPGYTVGPAGERYDNVTLYQQLAL